MKEYLNKKFWEELMSVSINSMVRKTIHYWYKLYNLASPKEVCSMESV
jgi:hypothetical protein